MAQSILLTNDDGVGSPALLPFARALEALGHVAAVVPEGERSWIGKAITRYGDVTLDHRPADGVDLHTTSGYPADAVQLGVHHLGPPPDLVVSGINLGYNHGTAFLMSSGTVGAAIEGWIAGIAAVAVSTGVMSDWHQWRAGLAEVDGGRWDQLSGVATEVVTDLIETGIFTVADVVSVNLPFDATSETERRITTIGRMRYSGLFGPATGSGFFHDYRGGYSIDSHDPRSDIAAALDGVISITPVRLPEAVSVPAQTRSWIERTAR